MKTNSLQDEQEEHRRSTVIAPDLTLADVPFPWTIESKIRIFEARTLGWQINIARTLLEIPHSGFATLAVLASYPEMIWQYRNGRSSRNESRNAFCAEAPLVFPSPDPVDWRLVYDRVRSGAAHEGLTKPGVALSTNTPTPVSMDGRGGILVNIDLWPAAVHRHFETFVSDLKNPASTLLRLHFDARFGHR